MTKIYIAAPYVQKLIALQAMQDLKRHGINTTSTWIYTDRDAETEQEKQDAARRCFSEIDAAQGLVLFTGSTTGGAEVELGFILGINRMLPFQDKKPIWIIGESRNIFHSCALVRRFASLPDAIPSMLMEFAEDVL